MCSQSFHFLFHPHSSHSNSSIASVISLVGFFPCHILDDFPYNSVFIQNKSTELPHPSVIFYHLLSSPSKTYNSPFLHNSEVNASGSNFHRLPIQNLLLGTFLFSSFRKGIEAWQVPQPIPVIFTKMTLLFQITQ